MSTRNPTHGQKVTDPNAPVIREGAGAIASDSLAAESDRAHGGFSGNRGGEPLGVSGANSTFANTDTSGARRLDPAIDAEARDAEADWGEESKLKAARNTQDAYETSGGDSNAGTAPSYVNSQFVDSAGPKGENLTEGFEGGHYNRKIGEVGTKNDPGRLAEEKMFRSNADGDSVGMPKQKGDTGENAYETLGNDESA